MGILKRKTLQAKSVEEIIEPLQGYAPIDFASIDKAISSKLTSAEFRVWLYVMKFDRYGDEGKWKDVPSSAQMGVRLGMDRRTVEKAMERLRDLELLDMRVKSWQIINSTAKRANATGRAMKQAKEETKTSEPEQDKSGKLAQIGQDNPLGANLPIDGLNNLETVEPAPDKLGYLAQVGQDNPLGANLPIDGLNNSETVILPSHIYKDHAREKTIQTNTNFKQTGRDSAATEKTESLKFEVFESKLHLLEKEQDLNQTNASESKDSGEEKFSASLELPSESYNEPTSYERDRQLSNECRQQISSKNDRARFEEESPSSGRKLLTTQQTPGTQQKAHEASALHDGDVLDPEVLKEIELIAYDWRKRPWMASSNKFKPEMIQAVWRCNPNWYSLEGSKTPNLKKICDRLRKLDAQLKKLDTDGLIAYSELQNYWSCAQAIANPEVEIAFAQVAITAKQQQMYAYYAQALNQQEAGAGAGSRGR